MTRQPKLDLTELLKHVEKSWDVIMAQGAEEIIPTVTFIKDIKSDKILKLSLSNYLIIRLVSIMESYCRESLRVFIDVFNFDFKGVFQNDEIKISILELNEIKKNEKTTAGRIIANSYNFQNLEEIDFVASKLLGRSFLKEVNVQLQKYPLSNMKIKYSFDWEEFHNIFTERHDIIHRMKNFDGTDGDKIARLIAHTILFCSILTIIFTEEYLLRNKDTLDKIPDLQQKFYDKLDLLKKTIS